MSAIITLSDADFAEHISGEQPILVDFWAEWCGPCRLVAPVLEAISVEHGDRLTIAKLNIDENPQTPASHDVMSIPTMILFQNGMERKRIVGARSKADMINQLSDWLSYPQTEGRGFFR